MSRPIEARTVRFGPLLIDYDDRVLTPRSWTLAQSKWAADLCADHPGRQRTDDGPWAQDAPGAPDGPILELCAGAGQIGLAAAVIADRRLIQVEADPVAARFARANAERAGRGEHTHVRECLLARAIGPDERFDIILADPPYLPTGELERWPEDPPRAIDGGPDGLRLSRLCLAIAARHLRPGGSLLLQVAGPRQLKQIDKLLVETGDWPLARREERVIDDERAILRVERDRAWLEPV